MVHNQSAQAMLCESTIRELEPCLELKLKEDDMGSDQRSQMRSKVIDELMVFGITRPAKVLCRCGAIAEIDRSVLRTKKDLGKVIECRRCRSMRIAREKEELDNDYYGMQESLE